MGKICPALPHKVILVPALNRGKVAAGGTGAALSGVSFAYETNEYRNNQKDRQQKGTAGKNSNNIIKE